MPRKGMGTAGPSAPSWVSHPSGGFRSICWHLGPEDERLELGGRAGPGSGSGIHCQPGQLVNFVGMHLVERRCINIRSLSLDCVSRLGGGGAGGPQMPFVKKTRMASRRGLGRLPLAHRQSSGSGLRTWGEQR